MCKCTYRRLAPRCRAVRHARRARETDRAGLNIQPAPKLRQKRTSAPSQSERPTPPTHVDHTQTTTQSHTTRRTHAQDRAKTSRNNTIPQRGKTHHRRPKQPTTTPLLDAPNLTPHHAHTHDHTPRVRQYADTTGQHNRRRHTKATQETNKADLDANPQTKHTRATTRRGTETVTKHGPSCASAHTGDSPNAEQCDTLVDPERLTVPP